MQFRVIPRFSLKTNSPPLSGFSFLHTLTCMEISRTSNKLKWFRRCQGYSQKKVARLLGLTDTTMLSKWEHGVSYPSLLHVFRLARMYQVLPHELFVDLWLQVGTEEHLLANDDEPFYYDSSLFI